MGDRWQGEPHRGLLGAALALRNCVLSRALPASSLATSPPDPTLIRVLPLNAPWNICKPGWAWEAGRGVLSPVGAGSLSPRQLWLLGPDRSPLSPGLGKALLAPGWHSCPSLAKGLSLGGPGHGEGGWGAGIQIRGGGGGIYGNQPPAQLPSPPSGPKCKKWAGGRGCGQRVAGGQGR